jgi:hypothetical protein
MQALDTLKRLLAHGDPLASRFIPPPKGGGCGGMWALYCSRPWVLLYRLASPFGISVGTASLDTSRVASPTASS